MIIIPTPGHTEQLTNARQAEKLGIARIILQEMLNKEKLLQNVQQLLQPKIQHRAEEIQKEALKHDGLETVAKEIMLAAKNEQVF